MDTVLALGLNKAFREKNAKTALVFDGSYWRTSFQSDLALNFSSRVVILRDNVHASLR